MAHTIADRVRDARVALGLNQRDAAAAAGISQSTWQRIEDGREPTLGQLGAIAHTLGRTVESLTETSTVQQRLVSATRLKSRDVSDGDRRELERLDEHLGYLMEMDAHLRYTRVGVHA